MTKAIPHGGPARHVVTFPDGTQAERRSERIYTHAVIARAVKRLVPGVRGAAGGWVYTDIPPKWTAVAWSMRPDSAAKSLARERQADSPSGRSVDHQIVAVERVAVKRREQPAVGVCLPPPAPAPEPAGPASGAGGWGVGLPRTVEGR